jgi:hypothetical protein
LLAAGRLAVTIPQVADSLPELPRSRSLRMSQDRAAESHNPTCRTIRENKLLIKSRQSSRSAAHCANVSKLLWLASPCSNEKMSGSDLCDVVAAELFSAATAPNRAPIPRHGMWGQFPGPWVPRFPKHQGMRREQMAGLTATGVRVESGSLLCVSPWTLARRPESELICLSMWEASHQEGSSLERNR